MTFNLIGCQLDDTESADGRQMEITTDDGCKLRFNVFDGKTGLTREDFSATDECKSGHTARPETWQIKYIGNKDTVILNIPTAAIQDRWAFGCQAMSSVILIFQWTMGDCNYSGSSHRCLTV